MIPCKDRFVKPFFKKNRKKREKSKSQKKPRKNALEFVKSLDIDGEKCYNKDMNFD